MRPTHLATRDQALAHHEARVEIRVSHLGLQNCVRDFGWLAEYTATIHGPILAIQQALEL